MISKVSTKLEKQSGAFIQISISSCNEKVGYFDTSKLKSNTVGRSKLRFRREISLALLNELEISKQHFEH